jgi:nucleoside 2-deoxyribosyltransferase
MTPRVYLAGPDVFHPQRARLFAERMAVCRRHGLQGVVPLDDTATTAPAIYRANVTLLESCAAVIANLVPFRGPHCDVGTAWEIGYAVGRGIPVFAFSSAAVPLRDRIEVGPAGHDSDVPGMLVEDFGLVENLMIAVSLADQTVHGDFEAAVAVAARQLGVRRITARP